MRGQLGLPDLQRGPVVPDRRRQRRLAVPLGGDPRPVRRGPVRRAPPDPPVPHQHRGQPLPRPLAVIQHHRARPRQVPHRLLRRAGYPYRRQLPRPAQPGQPPRVPLVRLDLVRAPLRDQRRRHHLARHPHRGQQPVQVITPRPGLIPGPQHRPVREPAHQPPDRLLLVEDTVRDRALLTRQQRRDHDRVLRGVHPQMDQPLRRCHTRHDGRDCNLNGVTPETEETPDD